MGLGNGNSNSGNKGSNFNYELRHLRLLGNINAALGGGLATEATLQSVLATLTSLLAEQRLDFEVKCIQDSNGDKYLMRISWDDAADTYTVDYIDGTGAVVVPVGAIEICSPDVLLQTIITELQTANTTLTATAADIASLLAAFTGTDFATETTLASLEACCTANGITLGDILTELTTLNAVDFSTEATLQDVLTEITDLYNLINAQTTPGYVEVTAAGPQTTTAGLKEVSLHFYGTGGTLNGVSVEDGKIVEFKNLGGVGSIGYTVPTTPPPVAGAIARVVVQSQA